MMLESSKGSLAAFSRELEFRANLFHRPLDSEALQKLQPQPSDVFRAARLAGADSEEIKTYISGLAARKLCLNDADTPSAPLLTEDAILHLANAEWSDFWQAAHPDGQNNSLRAAQQHRSLPNRSSNSPGDRNRSDDSHSTQHSHPHHHRYSTSAVESAMSERRSKDFPSPSLVRISVDLLTGGKSITAVMDPLSTVLDLKQRISMEADTLRTPKHCILRYSPLDRERIPPRKQVLFFGRERMLEQRTLHSYNIREGSHLVLSPTVVAGTL